MNILPTRPQKLKLTTDPTRAIVVFLTLSYVSYLTADILTGDSESYYSKALKYVCILGCFALTRLNARNAPDERDQGYLQAALFFVCIADFLIGILGLFIPGIAVFLVVQLILIVRHSRAFAWNRAEIRTLLTVFLPATGIFIYLAPTFQAAGLLFPVVVYAAVLVTGLWMALGVGRRGFYPPATAGLITVGMVLFFLTDVCVGVYNAMGTSEGPVFFHYTMSLRELGGDGLIRPRDVNVPFTLRGVVGILVWVFYLPGILALALSGRGGRFAEGRPGRK